MLDVALLRAEIDCELYKKTIEVLRAATRNFQNDTAKFPHAGCEHLLTQFLEFGSEKHDDAVGARVYLMLVLAGCGIEEPKVHYV
jgi:hypothetical protein